MSRGDSFPHNEFTDAKGVTYEHAIAGSSSKQEALKGHADEILGYLYDTLSGDDEEKEAPCVPIRLMNFYMHRARPSSPRWLSGAKQPQLLKAVAAISARQSTGYLSQDQVNQLKVIARHPDKTPCSRAQNDAQQYITNMLNSPDMVHYADILVNASRMQRQLYSQLIREHVAAFPEHSSLIAQLLEQGSTEVLTDMLRASTSTEKTDALLEPMIKHWLTHQDQKELIYQLADKQKHPNDNMLQVTKILFYKEPTSLKAALYYYNQLNLIPKAERTEAQTNELSFLKKAYELIINPLPGFNKLKQSIENGSNTRSDLELLFKITPLFNNQLQKEAFSVLAKKITKLTDNSEFLFKMGQFYQAGIGCEKNEDMAKAYYETAAKKGSIEAFHKRFGGELTPAQLLNYAKQDYQAATDLLQRLSYGDDTEAKIAFASCQTHGYGTRKQLSDTGDEPDEAPCPRDTILHSSRASVRFFDHTGNDFLTYQTGYLLMLLGAQQKEFQIAPHISDTSNGSHAYANVHQAIQYTQAYVDTLAEEEKPHWNDCLEDLRWSETLFDNDYEHDDTPTGATILARLDAGHTVSIASGWVNDTNNGHSINLNLFKVGEEYFLSYANKGQSNLSKSAIRIYRIDNPDQLHNDDWLKKLITKKDGAPMAYVDSHDKSKPGLGQDLQLTSLGVVNRSDQNGGNCAVITSSHAILNLHMIKQLQANHRAGTAATVNQRSISAAFKSVFMSTYKPWRFHMRTCAVRDLCNLGDCRERAYIPAKQHIDILKIAINRIMEKYPTHDRATTEKREALVDEINNFLDSPACGYTEEQKTEITDHINASYPVARASSPIERLRVTLGM